MYENAEIQSSVHNTSRMREQKQTRMRFKPRISQGDTNMTFFETLSKYRIYVSLFIFIAILDDISTYIGLTYKGLYEYNPIARHVFSMVGIAFGLIILKIIGLVIIVMLLYTLLYIRKPNVWMFRLPCAFMSLVIINNVIALSYGQSIIYYITTR